MSSARKSSCLPDLVPRCSSDGPYCWESKAARDKIRSIAGESNRPAVSSVLSVYSALAELASDAQAEEFEARRGMVAYRAGVNVRTVDAALTVLVKAKLVRIQRRRIDETTNLPSVYTLLKCSRLTKATPSAPIAQGGDFISPPTETIAPVANRREHKTDARWLKNRKNRKNIAPASPPQVRDELFLALAMAEGSDPDQLTEGASKRIEAALAQIRRATPTVTPQMIKDRAEVYRRREMPPGTRLTAHALAMHWAKCGPRTMPAGSPPPPAEPVGWRATLDQLFPGNAVSADPERTWASVDPETRAKVIVSQKERAAS